MASGKNDQMVIDTIKQIIKEVKSEMSNKKILSENKSAEVVFNKHRSDIKKYIVENVIKALAEAEK